MYLKETENRLTVGLKGSLSSQAVWPWWPGGASERGEEEGDRIGERG